MDFYQIGILFLQGALVAFIILILFRLRKSLGIGLLFACLGLFQFIQVFLSSSVYIELSKNLLVSPGSSVLFTATLFSILLIYIEEDTRETRKLIYALLVVNVIMLILLQIFSWNVVDPSTYNPLNVSTILFQTSTWQLFIGTLALLLDSLLIILIYEFISRHTSHLFLRICLTMLIVLSFDTFFFSVIVFWNHDNLQSILLSGLLSKGIFAFFYSFLFYLYIKYFSTKEPESDDFITKGIFHKLTYRQKFEMVTQDNKKASEEARINEIKYQTLTNISPVGIFHTRTDGYTTFVNPRWCEISGLKMNEALGDGWMKSVYPEDIEPIKKEWELATEEKRKSETEYRFLLNDGSVKWVLGQAVPELNDQNEIIGYVGTITDITDLKLYQQEQTKLKEKAEESNRLKTAFLTNMSHEIRTPMNGILGFAELLKQANLSDKDQHKYIRVIEKSGTRMLSIINDIISISKIESGIVTVNFEKLNINELMKYVFEFFKPEVEAKGINFSIRKCLPLEDCVFKTDREKFLSILTNLIKNAIKYTEHGTIGFGCVKKEDSFEFFVEDSGIGIPKERQDVIFERFMQADINDKMARQGAGLGLSISKAYIEFLGGKLWLKCEKEKGSVFYFTIPTSIN